MTIRIFSPAALFLLPLAGAFAATYQLPAETAALKAAAGPGFEAAQNNCRACHSADYIAIQPPNKGKPFWEAEVAKMVNVYKAPIAAEDMKAIAEYLAEQY